MLAIIAGGLGSGKTLLATIIGKESAHEMTIITNYKTAFTKVKFSLYDFVCGKYDNSLVIMDEAYTVLESRDYMSIRNQAVSYMLFQSRKKSMDLLLTVQILSTLDVRFRTMMDVFIQAHGLIRVKDKQFYKYTIYVNGTSFSKTIYISLEIAQKYYGYYDTNEIVQSENQEDIRSELLNPMEKLKKVHEIAKEIDEKFSTIKITKNTIKLELFERNMPNNLNDYIYEVIRQKRTKLIPEKKKSKN